MKRALVGMATVLATACSLVTPPIDTPHATQSITLSQMTGLPGGVAAPVIVPEIHGFRVKSPEGLAIDVPANAQSVPLSSATLHLRIANRMAIPLTIQLFLSKTSAPYDDPGAKLSEEAITLLAGETRQIDPAVDPALFKQPRVYLGVTFGSTGSGGRLVTVSGDDAVDVKSWATVQVKLL